MRNKLYNYLIFIKFLLNQFSEHHLIEKVEKDKKVSAFLTDLYGLQEKSILKITDDQKKINYRQLREEEEERKRDELEKLMKK